MHEASIARSILDIVEQEMGKRPGVKLKAVNVAIGKLSAVSVEQLTWWFTVMVAETDMAGAVLNVREVPIGYKCAECGNEFTSDEVAIQCPRCGAEHPQMVSGRELEVESLEVDE